MGRRGWQRIQVIRGPRPNSVVWPKARPQRVRTDSPHKTAQPQHFVSLQRSLCRRRRLEEFLQCENETLQTPSDQRRQHKSAGCRRPSTVWETEMQKARRHWSCLLPKHRNRPRRHAPDRRNSRVHRKGQEASRGRSEGGEEARFARTPPVGRVPSGVSAGRGTSPHIVPCGAGHGRLSPIKFWPIHFWSMTFLTNPFLANDIFGQFVLMCVVLCVLCCVL